MDRNLNMKSEAALIIKSTAVFTVIQLILDIIHPFFESANNDKIHLVFDFGFYIILALFTYMYLVKGNAYENDPDNQEDRSYIRSILWRLLVDLCFALLAISMLLGIVFCCISQMDELDTIHRHPSFLDKLLMRPTPDEQAKKIIEDYFNNTGYFFRIFTSLVNSLMYISCVRFVIVLGQLIINSIKSLFARNQN